eukprot:TRINITY_DN7803_c0_g1_i2.p1 TRINITY_DN7803_c0_g1~~TRINITY_DN7803_c0_g1_i2.p1  ORF type:complete len:122 (-),score=29.55 TRINITY_DN7803_c0_g1_i2:35-400(-)
MGCRIILDSQCEDSKKRQSTSDVTFFGALSGPDAPYPYPMLESKIISLFDDAANTAGIYAEVHSVTLEERDQVDGGGDNGQLPAGAIVGIVIASIFGIVLVIVSVIYFGGMKHDQKKLEYA